MTQTFSNLSNSIEPITGNRLLDLRLLFCGLFEKSILNSIKNNSTDLKTLILSEHSSRLLTANELEIVLKDLEENIYEVNCNRSIFAFKKTGKAFFINKSDYDLNIYLHQTNIEDSRCDFRADQDLMHTLMTLFSDDIPEFNREQLSHILQLIPNNCYQINCNPTTYSLKANGKPFFTDKSLYHMNSHEPNSNSNPTEDSREICLQSRTFGREFAEKNRLMFMRFKNYEKDMRRRLVEELKNTGHQKVGKTWISKRPLNPEIYLNRRKLISKNGNYDDPKEVQPIEDKWDKTLTARKIYSRSELMIRTSNMRETKHILSKCKESTFHVKDRTERRKKVQNEAIVKPVIDCDLLQQKLYSIPESNDSDLE